MTREGGAARALGVVLAAMILGVAGTLYWYVTRHGFSARERPLAIEAWVARNVRRLAMPAGARNMKNPLTPTPIRLAAARNHFADHCAFCHGNDGTGKTAVNEGLYPPAPNMREEDTQSLTDGELLYVIKNGVRFTGMPGWGGDDEENWKLVLFIRHLPKLTQEELDLMAGEETAGH